MKSNVCLSVLFAAVAVMVGFGVGASPTIEPPPDARVAASWATAFPVAQAGFAKPASAAN